MSRGTGGGDAPQPFLAALAAGGPRPLGAILPVHEVPAAISPWTPRPVEAASAPAPDRRELEAARAQAVAEGRAEGLRETEALRARLAALVGELARVRDANAAESVEAIADAAVTAIEAWLELSELRERFIPIVRAWLQHTRDGGGATAYVHPGAVAAMRAAIGEAMIAVEPDPALAPGDVRVRNQALDVTHRWAERLRELRDTIATGLERQAAAPRARRATAAGPAIGEPAIGEPAIGEPAIGEPVVGAPADAAPGVASPARAIGEEGDPR